MDLERLKLDRQGLIKAMVDEMDKILEAGSEDVLRCQSEVERTPDDAMAWFELGMAHHDAGTSYINLAFECEHLNYLEEHPEADDSETRNVTIRLPRAVEIFNRALDAYNKVEELDSEFYGLNCQRGLVYGNMHYFEEAIKCFLKALEEDDEDSLSAFHLAHAYHETGNEELSAKYLALAQSINPDEEYACSCMPNTSTLILT